MFCFCKFLWLVDLRICFCIKRARPWSKFKINLINRAWDLSREHWWDLITIHFVFVQFNCVSMSKIPSPPREFSWLSERSYFLLFHRKLHIFFLFFFLIYFGIVLIWHLYHRLDKRIWFTIIFLPLKEN